MMRTASVLFCLFLGADAHLGSKGAQGFLALRAEMQPEVVARTLMRVEDEWKAQAAAFAECNAAVTEAEQEEGGKACSTAATAFQKSCSTIVNTVVQASSGDRAVVQEYMGDVCGEKQFDEWHQGRCSSLSAAVVNAMGAESYDNRENFAAGSVCSGFWSSFVVEEQERVKKEKVEQATQEKEEEAQRVKAAQEAAEAEQKEAERKAAAEKARVEAEEEAAKHALQVNANSSNVVQANASNVSTHVQVSSENTTASSNATLTATDSAVTTPAPVADMANESAPVTNATQKTSQSASNVSVAVVSASNATASQNASVTKKEAAQNASGPTA